MYTADYKMSEIENLILLSRSGDDDAFTSIVSLYTPMLEHVAHSFSLDLDEVFTEACLALLRAVKTYKIGNGSVTFGLYAQICVNNAMKDYLRSANGRADTLHESVVVELASDEDIAEELVRREESELLRAAAGRILSDYEYSVLMRWLGGATTADIASELGTTAKSVDNAKARIQKKLRDGLLPS